jgi:hypothetical protein
VPGNESQKLVRKGRNDVRVIAKKALLQLLEPLVAFVLDCGLSAPELHSILREAVVRSAAARQLELARRVNISGIAASTGISRAEVSRILKSSVGSSRELVDRQQQSTNRILAVWHEDPKFTTSAGKPADLRMYGRGATFEALVKHYGRGIPTRAVLDELTRSGAAEVLSTRLVRVKTLVSGDRGLTPHVVRSFGERATELLSTMLQNLRNPDNPKFIASIAESNISPTTMPLFRRELANRGGEFLAEMREVLAQQTTNRVKKSTSRSNRVSVTIFYNESPRKQKPRKEAVRRRRNFRRDG